MAYGDQFKDMPENRERMQQAAEAYAWAQGVVYVVVRSKADGKLGVEPKTMFDPERDEVIFEVSGGGRKAADERWEEKWRQLRELGDLPEQDV
jgi:hypothetical protein